MIEIKIGEIRDLERVMPIMWAAFDPKYGEAWNEQQCASMLALPNTNLWLAESGGSLRGFAISRWILDEEELLMIAVDPDHQKYGVGKRLVSAVIENAIFSNRRMLFLEVRNGNLALEFYQSLGFIRIGTRENYYTGVNGSKCDAITMRLEINDSPLKAAR